MSKEKIRLAKVSKEGSIIETNPGVFHACAWGEQLEEKKRQEEQLRKRGENPNIPLTMKDLLHICPGFNTETLQRACDDLNLEIAKRIARETYPNKFK